MKRVVAGAVVILLTLLGPLAAASHGEWTPRSSDVPESGGTVILLLSKATPGRVVYRTLDGSCETWTDGNPLNVTYAQTVCQPPARASEDYKAVSGEAVFTEPGSKTIVIEILDDGIDEREETFSVEAHEVDHTAGGATGSTAIVNIVDDDDDDDYDAGGDEVAAAAATTSTTTARARPPGPASALTGRPVPDPAAAPAAPAATTSSTDLKVELASGDLRPGPGFELTTGGHGEAAPAPGGGGGGGGGSTSSVGLGLGSGALGAGAIWMRRQRRWSSKPA